MDAIQTVIDAGKCVGCGACAIVCPKHCIAMQENALGFSSPVIDRVMCVQCGACERVCTATHQPQGDRFLHVYMACDKDIEARKRSASGGIFALAAKTILADGGVVFGCVLENERVFHTCAETTAEMDKMRGSKYVQSDLRDTIHEAEAALNAGRKVLFSGTPCQIAALRNVLGRDGEGLYTIDVICHGVPGEGLFSRYIHWLEMKHGGSPVTQYRFRHKTARDYSGFSPLAQFADGTYYCRPFAQDPFCYSFSKGSILRASCYLCPYANPGRVSDLTLGDCASRSSYADFHPYTEMSTVLVNTSQGEKLWNLISKDTWQREINAAKEVLLNKQLHEPFSEPTDRETVLRLMMNGNFDEIAGRLEADTPRVNLWRRLRDMIPIRAKQIAYHILLKKVMRKK